MRRLPLRWGPILLAYGRVGGWVVGRGSCCDEQDADGGEPEACPLYRAQLLAEHDPGQQHGDPGVQRGQHDCQAEHAGPGGRYVADVRDHVDPARGRSTAAAIRTAASSPARPAATGHSSPDYPAFRMSRKNRPNEAPEATP